MGHMRPDRPVAGMPGKYPGHMGPGMPGKPGGMQTLPGFPGKPSGGMPSLPGKYPGQMVGAPSGMVAGPASWDRVRNLWSQQQSLQGQAGMGQRIHDLDMRRRAMMAQLQARPVEKMPPIRTPPIYRPGGSGPIWGGYPPTGGNTGIVPPWMRPLPTPVQSPPIYAPRPQIPEAGMIGINPRPGGVYF